MTKPSRMFIAYPGGKSRLLPEIRKHYPPTFSRYFEPFLGGGSVLFDVLQRDDVKEAFATDVNEGLVNFYHAIRNNCEETLRILREYVDDYNAYDSVDARRKHGREIVARWNEERAEVADPAEKAAFYRFAVAIALLSLVTERKGKIYTSFTGSRVMTQFDAVAESYRFYSKLLQRAEIACASFETLADQVAADSFVFLDPPYLAGWGTYWNLMTECRMSVHVFLRNWLREMQERGIPFVLTSDANELVADFFREFYVRAVASPHQLRDVNNPRSCRKMTEELIISNNGGVA